VQHNLCAKISENMGDDCYCCHFNTMARLLKSLRDHEACTDGGCETATPEGMSSVTLAMLWLLIMGAFLLLRPRPQQMALDSKPFHSRRDQPPPPPPAAGAD
jgi:MYXO-CTERM domain-containing protein